MKTCLTQLPKSKDCETACARPHQKVDFVDMGVVLLLS